MKIKKILSGLIILLLEGNVFAADITSVAAKFDPMLDRLKRKKERAKDLRVVIGNESQAQIDYNFVMTVKQLVSDYHSVGIDNKGFPPFWSRVDYYNFNIKYEIDRERSFGIMYGNLRNYSIYVDVLIGKLVIRDNDTGVIKLLNVLTS